MPKDTFWNLPEAKREKLIELAIEEFADNDFASASITRLVARAGIAKGSFYQYFEDKKELYLYLLELGAQEKIELLRGIEPPDPQMDLFAYLRWLFKLQADFQLKHPRLAEVAYRAFYKEVPFHDEAVARMVASSREYMRELIEQGIASGAIRTDVDREVATFVLSTTLAEVGRFVTTHLGIDARQLMERTLSDAERTRLNRLFDHFIDILECGLGQPGQKEGEP